jgi:hypothetical protein
MSRKGIFKLCPGNSDPHEVRKCAVEAALELVYAELDEVSSPANIQYHLEKQNRLSGPPGRFLNPAF